MVEKLKQAPLEDLPTVKKVMGRIKEESQSGSVTVTYQGVDFKEVQRGSNMTIENT